MEVAVQRNGAWMLELPDELLDYVCTLISVQQDVRSLSLTCKRLRRIVVPYHTEFRHISAHFGDEAVWTRLSMSPRAARTLHVRPPHPRQLTYHTLATVREMKNLEAFSWAVTGRFPTEELLAALRAGLPTLQSISFLSGRAADGPTVRALARPNHPLWGFNNLTHFSLALMENLGDGVATREMVGQYISHMMDLLVLRCPKLEQLHLQLDHTEMDLTDIFARGSWSCLDSLSIDTALTPYSFADSIMREHHRHIPNFVTRHPRLRYLRLMVYGLILPNLFPRALVGIAVPSILVSVIPASHIKQLESISTLRFYSPRDLNLLGRFTSLRKLEMRVTANLSGEDSAFKWGLWSTLAYNIRSIRNLKISFERFKNCTINSDDLSNSKESASVWISLASMHHLTHLSGFFEFDPAEVGKNNVLQMLAQACPTLVYVDVSTGLWVKIRREENRAEGRSVYAGWHRVQTEKAEKDGLDGR